MGFQFISTSQNSISNFFEENSKFWGFRAVVLVKTFYIDLSMTYVGQNIDKAKVISALKHNSKFNFELFVILIFRLPWCSTREDISIDISITNVGLILQKLWWFSRVYGRTDRDSYGIPTWKHVGTQKISTQSSKLGVSCWSLYASPEVGDSWIWIYKIISQPGVNIYVYIFILIFNFISEGAEEANG